MAANVIPAASRASIEACSSSHWRLIASTTCMVIEGAFQIMNAMIPTMTGPVTTTQRATTTRAERRSSATLGWVFWPGMALRRIGPIRPNRSGTPTRSATTK